MVSVPTYEQQEQDITVVVPASPTLAVTVEIKDPITKGERGYSAYEVWIMEGGVGSETEFLESLVGKDGLTTAIKLNGETYEQVNGVVDLGEISGGGDVTKEYVDAIGKHSTDYTDTHNANDNAHSDIRQIIMQESESRIQADDAMQMQFINESFSVQGQLTTKPSIEYVNAADNTLRSYINSRVGLPAYNPSTYELTFTTHNGVKAVIDLPIEQIGLTYDPATKEMIFVNANGQTQRISLADFIDVYIGSISNEIQIHIGSNNIIEATLLDESVGASKLTTALSNLINGKQSALTAQQLKNIADVPIKADKDLQNINNDTFLGKALEAGLAREAKVVRFNSSTARDASTLHPVGTIGLTQYNTPNLAIGSSAHSLQFDTTINLVLLKDFPTREVIYILLASDVHTLQNSPSLDEPYGLYILMGNINGINVIMTMSASGEYSCIWADKTGIITVAETMQVTRGWNLGSVIFPHQVVLLDIYGQSQFGFLATEGYFSGTSFINATSIYGSAIDVLQEFEGVKTWFPISSCDSASALSTTNTLQGLRNEMMIPTDPIAPTIGDIDHFRIINKNGQSQKATITQVRELMGMDYSKLEEQIVHGEYWLDADGVKRQVYIRTFQGSNSPAVFPQGIPSQIYSFAWSFYQIGTIITTRLIYATIGGHEFINPTTGQPNFIWKGFDLWFKDSINPKFNNVDYSLTFKYTKR